jgi:hypothetical protein
MQVGRKYGFNNAEGMSYMSDFFQAVPARALRSNKAFGVAAPQRVAQ